MSYNLKRAFDDMVTSAIQLWEGRTGRQGSYPYTAPELSMTKTLLETIRILEARVYQLEHGIADNKKPTEPSGTVGFSKSGCTSCEISDCTCFQNRCECDQ